MKFHSADLGRVDFFFVGDDSSFLYYSFPIFSDPSFEVDDLCEEFGRTCAVAQSTPVRCLTRRPDQSQTIGHVGSSCRNKACTSGRGLDPMAARVRRNTPRFCLCLFQNPLAQVFRCC